MRSNRLQENSSDPASPGQMMDPFSEQYMARCVDNMQMEFSDRARRCRTNQPFAHSKLLSLVESLKSTYSRSEDGGAVDADEEQADVFCRMASALAESEQEEAKLSEELKLINAQVDEQEMELKVLCMAT